MARFPGPLKPTPIISPDQRAAMEQMRLNRLLAPSAPVQVDDVRQGGPGIAVQNYARLLRGKR